MGGEENCRQDFGGATWKKDILWKTMAYMEENIKIELKEIGLGIVDQPTGRPAVGSCEGGNEPT
jgi:hypothetical protein